jgi:DNA-directed RNA polymerase subunit RPC12/RpoP
MERNIPSWKLGNDERHDDDQSHEDTKCGECGEEYRTPLVAKLTSQGIVETYYACPRCLTKVPESRQQKSEESPVSLSKMMKGSEKHEEKAGCGHFFGYLGKRPKDTAIPEDCLTCEKMIECMMH